MSHRQHNQNMRFSTLLATIAFAALATQSYAACKEQSNCATCLANKFCGWCSPDPTVFDDKSKKGSQCQDQRESGWHCDHLYSTEKCLIGYVCDHVNGQCAQDPKVSPNLSQPSQTLATLNKPHVTLSFSLVNSHVLAQTLSRILSHPRITHGV